MRTFYAPFGLDEATGLRIMAEMVTDVYKNCMCETCGLHPIESKALRLILDNQRQYQENERSFLLYLLGITAQDYGFWDLIDRKIKVLLDIDPIMAINQLEQLFKDVINDLRAISN